MYETAPILKCGETFMFTQFRVRYPKGSLVTELVTVEHGKYIVRCLIQVEGTTLVTGLAAAETVELAEDQARDRAFAVLGLDTTTVIGQTDTPVAIHHTVPEVIEPTSKAPTAVAEAPIDKLRSLDATVPHFANESIGIEAKDVVEEKLEQPQSTLLATSPTVGSTDDFSFPNSTPTFEPATELGVTVPEETEEIPFTDELPSSQMETMQEVDTPTVKGKKKSKAQRDETPASSYSHDEQETSPGKASTVSAVTTAIDFSELIARTNVELKRLGWTNQQGRDYLLQTYGKRSRQLLSDDELVDFLHHLESEPTPE